VRAHEVSFLDLVQGEKQFQVPLYQRTYSWMEPQLGQLWRDILEQGEAIASGTARSAHFIGSVVIAPSPTLHAGGVQRWLVVDGQQRLTTLMLALTAIRDHVGANGGSADADRVHRQYLVNEFRQGDDHLRLLPTQADRDTYRALVLRTAGGSVAGNVEEAYRFFRTALVTADDPDDDEDVNRIEQTIRAGLSLVEITAERGDNVYRIFESLNNTGLQLSQADLLRNYLFMRLPNRGEDVYRDVWLPMQDQLASRDLELLVWLDLVIRGDERVKQTEVYRAQQERLEQVPDDEAAIEAEIVELARRSRHLERILHPSREPDTDLRAALLRLKAWGASTAYPLVMHLLDLQERKVASTDGVVEALRYVESYLVRRMMCQVPTNNLNRVFNTSPQAIGETAPVAAAVRIYLSGRRRYWPSDAELRRSIRTRPFYWTGRSAQRTFVLRRLEESYNAAEPVDFDRAKLTIEHVLPQTPTPDWLDLLSTEVTDEAGPKELHELLVHTLGNLTLTAENAKLSNIPFQRKQDIYDSSSLQMNREIADTDTWGKAQILARAERLANSALQLWPGPTDAAHDDTDGRDWTLLRRACAALPPGTWTTYGHLAELIGSHPVPVGVHLATNPVPNAWRVLMADGTISPGFRWEGSDRTDDPQQLLKSEGVIFADGHAEPAQRITAAELAGLLGMETGDTPAPDKGEVTIDSDAGQRFLTQLGDAHAHSVDAVVAILRHWQTLGGQLSFGRASETSCFLILDAGRHDLDPTWPFAIYPKSGTVEVVFQHMRRRPVFDDIALRDEFRHRLQPAGIVIPESKLNLRPSFRLELLRDPAAREAVQAALEWFTVVFHARLAQTDLMATVAPDEVLGVV
jgi:alkylated DNA nucleotide flippase Atl1